MSSTDRVSEGNDSFQPKVTVFGEIAPSAKPISAGWSLLQVPLFIFLPSAVFAILIAVIVAIVAAVIGVSNGMTEADFQEPPVWFIGVAIAGAVLGFFGGFLLMSVFKTKLEKRSLASAGITGFLFGGRYWRGFIGGIALALILTIPGVVLGAPTGTEEINAETLNWTNLQTTGFAIFVIVLIPLIMVQSTSEEVLFRGWLLSGTAARHGWVFSLLFTSLFFGLAHADRFVAGPIWGIYALLVTASLGVLFACVSRATKSVIPAAGLHSGYNATLITAAVAYISASSEDGNIFEAFSTAFDLSNVQPPEIGLPFIADFAVRVFLPAIIGIWFLAMKRDV